MFIRRSTSGDSEPYVRSGRPPARRRHVPIAALALVALASCGDSDAPSGSAPTSPASQSDSTDAAAPDPTTVPMTAPTTAAPEPTVTEPAVASTQPTTTSDVAAGGYVPVDIVPALVGGVSDPIEVPLPDGVYWSWEYASAGDSVEFVLSQLFTGDACVQRFGAEACPSENNTLFEPRATITMAPTSTSVTVFVAAGEAGFDRFAVSAIEFARLVDGQAPAPDAPAGFSFERHPVVIVVTGGEIESVDQVFMS